MRWKEEGGLRWIEFEIFDECPRLVHGVFSRHGGVCEPPFDTLNVSTFMNDQRGSVRENLHRMCQALDLVRIVSSNHIHGTRILEVTCLSPDEIGQADGLIVIEPNLGIVAKHADCQAAIIYDPIRQVLATVHCGWRGNVQNIYQVCIERLKSQYGCRSENLLVGISPSLGPESAEFVNFEKELPRTFWEHQPRPTYFDLWQISERQLVEAGVLLHHIQMARIDTLTHPEDWFSYRREKRSGRHGTVAALR